MRPSDVAKAARLITEHRVQAGALHNLEWALLHSDTIRIGRGPNEPFRGRPEEPGKILLTDTPDYPSARLGAYADIHLHPEFRDRRLTDLLGPPLRAVLETELDRLETELTSLGVDVAELRENRTRPRTQEL